ncbi:LuxR C-terminal-related transcriptional regulator [Hallella multisaccharivorax]|uniref:LuxR C-terminal-related transcriptional regulator n=1 Tax=Hallella multisaccharivorax TaxID=310514 RepID=UPI00361060A0
MKNQKMYEPEDKLINIISDNYAVLQSLGSFGINLGFGDKTVEEVCRDEQVDTYTFLAVVNFTVNGSYYFENASNISVPTLLHYLKASHEYFLGFQLPSIRRELEEALDETDSLAKLILKLYEEYEHSIRSHMQYEEKTVFPYVEALERGEQPAGYDVQTYSKHHSATDRRLAELKNIIIKYLPSDGLSNNQLTATLYDIYNCEEWLQQHAAVEEQIFIPAVRLLERKSRQSDVSMNISNIIGKASDGALSEREKDVIISLVQGMSNKEIAEHLFISVNTVITHRRNIAKKLQIHSAAGLTIYAIVNKLVDISSVKL